MNVLQANLKFKDNISFGNVVKKIIIHHADIDNCTVQDIDSWHKAKGWAGCGYHYFIRKNGEVYQARPDNMVGCHAGIANYQSLGICFEGNFEKQGNMTDKQFNAGVELLKSLIGKYGLSGKDIFRHKDFCNTDCPGKYFPFSQMVQAISGKVVLKKGCSKLLEKCKNVVIQYGSSGTYVTLLQTTLVVLGYNPNGIDGHCGPGCVAAIKDYQKDHGLTVDGSCGPATWTSLLTD